MPHINQFQVSQLESLKACPFCQDTRVTFLFFDNGFPLVQCDSCKLMYLKERVKQEYIHLIYDSPYHSLGNIPYIKRVGEKRLNLLGQISNESVIFEDGAGNGAFVAACLERGLNASGCDLGRDSVQKAKELFDVDLYHCSIHSMGLGSNSVDIFACFNLLSHVYEPWTYINTIAGILKPHGKWLLRTGNRQGFIGRANWGNWSAPEHVYHYNFDILERLFMDAGLRIKWMIPAFDSDYPYLFFQFSRSGYSLVHKAARKLSSYVSLAWTILKLPKEDVYILVEKE